MGLTYQQAKALNIGHLHPAASGARSDEAIIRELVGERAPPPPKRTRGPNKLEAAFMEVLDAAQINRYIAHWRYEAITLRLAGRCRFTPDFLSEPRWQGDKFTFVETKGPYAREDSLIKLKVAAETYPCFRWLLVTRAGRHGWEVRQVDRNGIGREPIVVPWIGGGG